MNKSEEKNSGQISVASKGDRFREGIIYGLVDLELRWMIKN